MNQKLAQSVVGGLLVAAVVALASQAITVARLEERLRALEARVTYFHGSPDR